MGWKEEEEERRSRTKRVDVTDLEAACTAILQTRLWCARWTGWTVTRA
jgi:hypothetical protein